MQGIFFLIAYMLPLSFTTSISWDLRRKKIESKSNSSCVQYEMRDAWKNNDDGEL